MNAKEMICKELRSCNNADISIRATGLSELYIQLNVFSRLALHNDAADKQFHFNVVSLFNEFA